MKHTIIKILVTIYLIILSGPLYAQSMDQLTQSISDHIASWIDSESVLGAELLVIQDGKQIKHQVWGWDDWDHDIPMRKNQLFRIHSMTKPFTGTAILLLKERGVLKLDDKVSEYLSCYDNEKCRNISIRQLLNHTAGFVQPAYPRGSIDLYASLDEAVRDLSEQGPKYEPGTAYHYSDGHSASLGLLVTKLSGIPVDEFIQESIFKPLGMKHSYCSLEESGPDREMLCDTYIWKDGKYQKLWDNMDEEETSFFRASGGIITTVEDYARFLSLWMNRGKYQGLQLLDEETTQEALEGSDLNKGYAMHWEIYHQPDDSKAMPVFGHSGSSGTLAIAIPEHQAMVFYFTQSRGTLSANFLTKIILEEMGYLPKASYPDIQIPPSKLEQICGNYLVGKENWKLEATGDKLLFRSGRLVPIEFIPASNTTYVNRYMDMKLEFPEDFLKQKELTFTVNGNSIIVKKVD